MRNFIVCVGLFVSLAITGCGFAPKENPNPQDNFPPKAEKNADNQQVRIEQIENNQNAMKAEINRLALMNFGKENTGTQILQGDGVLFLLFCIITNFLVIVYFHKIAENEKKTSQILAEQIVKHQDEILEINVKRAAAHSQVEEKISQLLKQEHEKQSKKL